MKIKLGSRVQDIYTGFEGMAVAKTEWLNGCVRIGIQPTELDKDGKIQEEVWFDEQQVKVVKKTQPVYKAQVKVERPGGPQKDPKQYR